MNNLLRHLAFFIICTAYLTVGYGALAFEIIGPHNSAQPFFSHLTNPIESDPAYWPSVTSRNIGNATGRPVTVFHGSNFSTGCAIGGLLQSEGPAPFVFSCNTFGRTSAQGVAIASGRGAIGINPKLPDVMLFGTPNGELFAIQQRMFGWKPMPYSIFVDLDPEGNVIGPTRERAIPFVLATQQRLSQAMSHWSLFRRVMFRVSNALSPLSGPCNRVLQSRAAEFSRQAIRSFPQQLGALKGALKNGVAVVGNMAKSPVMRDHAMGIYGPTAASLVAGTTVSLLGGTEEMVEVSATGGLFIAAGLISMHQTGHLAVASATLEATTGASVAAVGAAAGIGLAAGAVVGGGMMVYTHRLWNGIKESEKKYLQDWEKHTAQIIFRECLAKGRTQEQCQSETETAFLREQRRYREDLLKGNECPWWALFCER